jgi:hypothetical protein
MADTKISAMTAATSVLNADEVPIVHAGVNFRTSRALLLVAGAAENIELLGSAGQAVHVAGFGLNGLLNIGVGGVVELSGVFVGLQAGPGGATNISLLSNGDIDIVTAPTRLIQIGDSGGLNLINIQTGGAPPFQIISTQSVFVTYVAANPLNWVGGSPTDFAAAIDRIATAVAGLLAGPIP